MKSRKPLTGRRFGRLIVLSQFSVPRLSPTPKHPSIAMVRCLCDCGSMHDTQRAGVVSGSTTSCGCAKHELDLVRLLKHGMARKREYISWQKMKARCLNQNLKSWPRYGGRGIKVCARWRNSFSNFMVDMGPRPAGKSLDRIDNNGPYSPKNCRWATSSEQQINRQNTRKISFMGETRLLREWAEVLRFDPRLLSTRLYGLKWSVERAFFTPPRHGKSKALQASVKQPPLSKGS